METFLTLAGQLFIVLCIQSILEIMAYSRRQDYLSRPIALGCYLACLLLVIRFMQQYIQDIMQMISSIF